jgi:hypothetical protein
MAGVVSGLLHRGLSGSSMRTILVFGVGEGGRTRLTPLGEGCDSANVTPSRVHEIIA